MAATIFLLLLISCFGNWVIGESQSYGPHGNSSTVFDRISYFELVGQSDKTRPVKSYAQILSNSTNYSSITRNDFRSSSFGERDSFFQSPKSNVSKSRTKVNHNNPESNEEIVSNEELLKFTEELFLLETNDTFKNIKLSFQQRTTSDNLNDLSLEPLLMIDSEVYNAPTISKMLTIYDNYNINTKEIEYTDAEEYEEESVLLNTFLDTNVMKLAMSFLTERNLIENNKRSKVETLRRLWFGLYPREKGRISSCGFEHVFMAEIKANNFIGLHNWIYYSIQEKRNHVNYLGYMKKLIFPNNKGLLIKLHMKFDELNKPVTSMFVGTSPELEMSLYTVCFLARRGKLCPISLGGKKFNIMTHNYQYNGKQHIGSAYPSI